MSSRVLGTGVIGGLLASCALVLPLYQGLPSAYSSTWPKASESSAMIGYVLALLVTLAAGYTAARWNWATTIGQSVVFGGVAGAVTGLLTHSLIGAGAAGVAGNAAILLHGPKVTHGPHQMSNLLSESLIRIFWWTHLNFYLLLALGALLGSIGGSLYHPRQGALSEEATGEATPGWGSQPRRVAPIVWHSAAVYALLLSALTLLVTQAVIVTMQVRVINSITSTKFTPTLDPRGIYYWSLGIEWVMMIIATAWTWNYVVGWNHPTRDIRINARFTGVIALLIPLATAWMITIIGSPDSAVFGPDLLMPGGIAILVVVTIAGAARSLRGPLATTTPEGASSLPKPDLSNGLDFLLTSWMVLLGLCTLISVGLSISMGMLNYIAVMTPARAGQTKQLTNLPNVNGTIHDIMATIFKVNGLGVLVVAVVSTLVFLGGCWISNWMRTRRPASPLPENVAISESTS